jgi:hypothetical protein
LKTDLEIVFTKGNQPLAMGIPLQQQQAMGDEESQQIGSTSN